MNEQVHFIDYQGRRILRIDLSNCPKPELIARIAKARELIGKQLPASVLTLTDVTGSMFDDEIVGHMREYTRHNKPFVRAAAVVGVTGLKKIVLNGIRLFTGREIKPFDEAESAKRWLVERANARGDAPPQAQV